MFGMGLKECGLPIRRAVVLIQVAPLCDAKDYGTPSIKLIGDL